jgi:deoxyadenosine/deoxycytidine kinase
LAQLVRDYLNNLEVLEEEVSNNADKILDVVDLDKLLEDPENYLLSLGDAFIKEHIDEIQEASNEGKVFANKVIKQL